MDMMSLKFFQIRSLWCWFGI